ncbi:MAG: hypothetical protein GWN58_60015 [Anaerolineae bacterium]|nr:hypothetical protein [Anaerolineae bacterium]
MHETSQVVKQSYTLAPDEKATQVMIGTADTLMWGDLVTKQAVRMSAYLNTTADDYVPLRDAKILYLAPREQTTPIERAVVHIRQEEILLFFVMHDEEPLPEETQTRRYEPIEAIIGSFQMEGSILKAPVSNVQNLLLVSKATYMPIYSATVRHVAKPWLGTFSSSFVQVRCERMILTEQ